MIAIIDYKAGNLASVSNALKKLNTEFVVTSDIETLNKADGIIFPGVGHAKAAMEALREKDLDQWIKSAKQPVLGICLGMQLLFTDSEEGGRTPGLDIIPGSLKKFDSTTGKVPHMGWNMFPFKQLHPLLKGLQPEESFYYVHSFYAPVTESTVLEASYAGVSFSSIVAHKNFIGVQFHPEKSGHAGQTLIQNFLDMVYPA
jgi:glutamine amidotransferase